MTGHIIIKCGSLCRVKKKTTTGCGLSLIHILGAIKELNTYYNFQIMPGFKTPDWAKGAVMYQIFADRFAMVINLITCLMMNTVI